MAAIIGACALLAGPAMPSALAGTPDGTMSPPACATAACPDGTVSPSNAHTVTITAGPNTIQAGASVQDAAGQAGPSLSASDVTALLQQSATSAAPTRRVAGKTVSSARGASPGTTVAANATCDAGHVLYGGGGQVTTSDGRNLDRGMLTASYASADNTWTVMGVVAGAALDGSETLNVTATAICSA